MTSGPPGDVPPTGGWGSPATPGPPPGSPEGPPGGQVWQPPPGNRRNPLLVIGGILLGLGLGFLVMPWLGIWLSCRRHEHVGRRLARSDRHHPRLRPADRGRHRHAALAQAPQGRRRRPPGHLDRHDRRLRLLPGRLGPLHRLLSAAPQRLMYPTLGDLLGPTWPLSTHGFFVGLGVVAATVVFLVEARRRGQTDERLLYVVTGALLGGRDPHAPGHVAPARRPARERLVRRAVVLRQPQHPVRPGRRLARASTSPSGCAATAPAPATCSPRPSRSAWRSAGSAAC